MTDIPKYERKCKNWLVEYARWALPRSEAPESFIFWTGLYNLAAGVRRHVFVPKRMLGSWECYPNLYVMFIAGAGKARKSTTVNYTEELVDEVPNITRSPELITKESLMSTIANSPDVSIHITAPEFGEFIVKSGPDMYGFLTNAYDGKRRLGSSTVTRGGELAERPCVNLIGATTPEWVAANMPESVIGGGFASRVIFLFEERVRRRQLYYENLNHEVLEQIRLNLVADLTHISLNLHGDFKLTEDAKEFMEGWYDETSDSYSEADYKMHGFFERLPAHVHKVAMLLHVAYSDELVLTVEDFQKAILLLKQVEHKLPQTFQSIGKNPYTVDMGRIMTFINERKKIDKREIRARFYHAATPAMLDELISGLGAMGYINQDIVGDQCFITLTKMGVDSLARPESNAGNGQHRSQAPFQEQEPLQTDLSQAPTPDSSH